MWCGTVAVEVVCETCSGDLEQAQKAEELRTERAKVALTVLAAASGAELQKDKAFNVVYHCAEAGKALGMAPPPNPMGAFVTKVIDLDGALCKEAGAKAAVESTQALRG